MNENEYAELSDDQLKGASGGVNCYWKGLVKKGVKCETCNTVTKYVCAESTYPVHPEEVGGFKSVLCRTIWECSNCGAKWTEMSYCPSQYVRRFM